MKTTWGVKESTTPGLYVVTWDRKDWGMKPRSFSHCVAYLTRLKERYPEGGEWLVLDAARNKRQKGGPWRYILVDGTTEVIHTDRRADAKAVLQARMGRKRLPNGILWSLEA